jgi:hypothetical protein
VGRFSCQHASSLDSAVTSMPPATELGEGPKDRLPLLLNFNKSNLCPLTSPCRSNVVLSHMGDHRASYDMFTQVLRLADNL